MAANDTRSEAAAAARQAKTERAEELTGIASAFQYAADGGPQVLAFGQALLDGIALSQRREADRLAKRNKDDPRIAETLARADRSAALSAEALVAGTAAGRVVDGFRRDGLFQGYVSQSDATPAVGYTVQLRGVAGLSARQSRAKTDADGYFRIDLGVGKDTAQGTRTVQEMVDHISLMGAANTQAGGAAADQTGPVTDVEVLDPSGRTVLVRDPAPPDFANNASAFRYYVISGPAAEAATAKTTSKTSTKTTAKKSTKTSTKTKS